MKLLEKFEPRLVGAGAATARPRNITDIQLHVFSDSTEAVYMHLMDRRYDYEVFERKREDDAGAADRGALGAVRDGKEIVEAFVFPKDGIRQAPISPVDGKPMRRAAIPEVESLL